MHANVLLLSAFRHELREVGSAFRLLLDHLSISARTVSWVPVIAGSSVHSFRFEATYDCGVAHLLSISREFDLMASWNRFVLNPCVLQEPTLFSSLLVCRPACRGIA